MSDRGQSLSEEESARQAGHGALEHALTRVINRFSEGASEPDRVQGLALLGECVREGADLAEVDARLRQLSRDGYLRDALVAMAAALLRSPQPDGDVALRLAEELCDALDLELGVEIARALIQIEGADLAPPARGDLASRANLLLGDTFAHQADHEAAARHYDAVLAYDVDHQRALRAWSRCMDVLEKRGHRPRGGSRGLELVSGLESLELAGQAGLERYEIGRPLGRGRHAVVYEAWDRQVGRRVALKRLLGESARKDGLSDRVVDRHFFAEARTLSRVRSPYVVALLDVQARYRFVALELCEGGNLRRALRRGRLGLEALPDIARQLDAALRAVHAAGAIHRDVKPANLLLRSPNSLSIALADFGVAVERTTPQKKRRTRAGTLRYLAPELRRGERATPAADLFSAGAVLLEIAMHPTPLPDAFDRLDDPGEARELIPSALEPELRERLASWLDPDPRNRK
jgi:tRNA A-37 threonylcarbamoyl transferase component Bud32